MNQRDAYDLPAGRGKMKIDSKDFRVRAIDKFVRDRRLTNLLKLLVVLICLGAILQRVLPLAGINWF